MDLYPIIKHSITFGKYKVNRDLIRQTLDRLPSLNEKKKYIENLLEHLILNFPTIDDMAELRSYFPYQLISGSTVDYHPHSEVIDLYVLLRVELKQIKREIQFSKDNRDTLQFSNTQIAIMAYESFQEGKFKNLTAALRDYCKRYLDGSEKTVKSLRELLRQTGRTA